MRKLLLAALVMISAVLLSGCTLPFTQGKKAALQVTSNPKTTVFLNDEHVGSTPFFDEKIKPGDYRIKLVPEGSSGGQAVSWEGQVKLVSGVLTVISRDLAETEEKSSGYVVTMEPKTDKTQASMAIVTLPDGAVVTLDGEPKGFAPINVDNTSEGEHLLVISSPGYVEKSIKAKAVKGYKLSASVQLSKMPEEIASPTPEATASAEPSAAASTAPKSSASPKPSSSSTTITNTGDIEKPYVLIKSPDTGWVRVRSLASTSGDELAKANDGEKLKYVSSDNGWYEVEYEESKTGWISAKYAELYE